MAKKQSGILNSVDKIEQLILIVRAQRVMLDADLAELYGVEVRTLNQAVKRNLARFPPDFMFRLRREEWTEIRNSTVDQLGAATSSPDLRSQNVILEPGRGRYRKFLPYAFTEQGIAMLSSVLRSQRAVNVNIEIMRTFVRLRRLMSANSELASRLDELERRVGKHDEQFVQLVRAIRQLMDPPAAPTCRKIGFHAAPEELREVKQRGRRSP